MFTDSLVVRGIDKDKSDRIGAALKFYISSKYGSWSAEATCVVVLNPHWRNSGGHSGGKV